MCTTRSGRALYPSNFGCPTLEDMAVQLGRLPRFAGATGPWWSVLHHLMVGSMLIEHELLGVHSQLHDVQCFFHLHDGNELATGDVPSTWKTADMRAPADRLQDRIYLRYIGRLPDAVEKIRIKDADLLSMVAEMIVVGPPNVGLHSGIIQVDTIPAGVLETAVEIVRDTTARYPDARSSTERNSPLVGWFLTRCEQFKPAQHVTYTEALYG